MTPVPLRTVLFAAVAPLLLSGCGDDCAPVFEYEWSARRADPGQAIDWANATEPPPRLAEFVGRAVAHELGGEHPGVLALDEDDERQARTWLAGEWERQVGTSYDETFGPAHGDRRAVLRSHGVHLELYESLESHADVACP